MLKIKDATGKTVGVLKDDDDAPEMVPSEKLLLEDEAVEELEKLAEEEGEEDADVR